MNSISSSYYAALAIAYGVSLLGWWLINLWKPIIWKYDTVYPFQHPWRETLWVLLAAIGTIGIGQLYSHNLLLPETGVVKSPLTNSINQIIIFFPFILLLFIRHQPFSTVWLPSQFPLIRVGVGIALALCAIIVFLLIRKPEPSFFDIIAGVYHPKNLGYAVQVFLQDCSVAMLLVRFKAAVGKKWFLWVIIVVAFLFSASHYPLKMTQGLSFITATREILIDGLLVSGILYVIQRSQDILWFWCIHFAMDMMQFYAGKPDV